jgi:hypothetical protein
MRRRGEEALLHELVQVVRHYPAFECLAKLPDSVFECSTRTFGGRILELQGAQIAAEHVASGLEAR